MQKLGELPPGELPLMAEEPRSFADVLKRAVGVKAATQPAPPPGGEDAT
jgi:hypothetical protein